MAKISTGWKSALYCSMIKLSFMITDTCKKKNVFFLMLIAKTNLRKRLLDSIIVEALVALCYRNRS